MTDQPAPGDKAPRAYRRGRGHRFENRVMTFAAGLGLIPHSTVLITRGRKTGQRRENPITVLDHRGRQSLVAPYGPVPWVLNARAAGRVEIRRRGRTRAYRVTEAGPEQAGPVLKDYVRVATVTRAYFVADKDDPAEAFSAEADRHPVFELTPADEVGTDRRTSGTPPTP